MRVALIALAACGGHPMPEPHGGGDQRDAPHTAFAEPDESRPSYGKAELARALADERAAEAIAAGKLDELADDAAPGAAADLAVRRRFIASLEACQATDQGCPPRLDDPPWRFSVDDAGAKPPLDTALRFDLDDWRKIADELHGRACACRTIACVDSLGVAIDQLETRPTRDVEGDDTASASITRARECLYRLRGKAIARP